MGLSTREALQCSACGARAVKWQGRCPSCGAWGTLTPARGECSVRPLPITEVPRQDVERIGTGLSELDRLLGGGLVPGSAILLGGAPGIGKSTLVTMLAARLARRGKPVLYASGEESAPQVRLRAERLGALAPALHLVTVTAVEEVTAALGAVRPAVLVLDSIQTVSARDATGPVGSPAQVREAAHALVSAAKAEETVLILIGHVTKDGSLAGPRTLEHLVDVVLSFDGDRHQSLRLLRTLKNRFGPAGELAVLEMAEEGLEEVPNPSLLFLRDRQAHAPGSVVTPALIGRRTFLVEVQALAAPASQGMPRRVVAGLDQRRVQLLMAILERACGLPLSERDVYVNVVGGLLLEEPGADLAVALALASAVRERPVAGDVVVMGEVGLMGEVRMVSRLETRLADAARLGFRQAIVPASTPPSARPLRVWPVARLAEALTVARVG